jgi:processing peptidase subunit beta
LASAATYQDTLNNAETKVTSTTNKLRVATETNNSTTATVGVWVNAGSRFENAKNNGVSHFLEHMIFKGSAKRSQIDLETEVESLGMQLSAQADREQFALYAKCMSKDVHRAVEILADLIKNPTFANADVDKESGVVLRELQESENDLKTVTMDYLHAAAYQGTPLSYSILGTTQTVKWLTRNELLAFVGTHFKPPRMVLAAAGGVNHDELVTLGTKHLSNMSLTYEREIPVLSKCRFTGSEVRARYDDLPLTHVAIAIEGAPFGSRDSLVLMVASELIGSWERTYGGGANLASKLASACAQEEMCHSFESFYNQYTDTGLWGLYFVADRLTIEDMMFNVQGEWMRLCSSVTDFEVTRAKNQLKTRLLQRLDGTTSTCSDLARQVLNTGRGVSPAELDAAIDAITAQTVREVGMKYIYDKCPAVVGVGPVEALPDYNRVRGSMYWLRF